MVDKKVQEAIDEAETALNRLRKAKSARVARTAWMKFLECSNRAVNRLEGYSKKNGKLSLYKELITKEIWKNPLTAYMRAARNAHEHGIADLDVDNSFNERVVFPDGSILPQIHVICGTRDGEQTLAKPIGWPQYGNLVEGAKIIRLPPTISLAPILAKDGQYLYPPLSGLLESEVETQASFAARHYLTWVKAKVAQFG